MFDQLTGTVVVPKWRGQFHQHLKLTAFDDPEDVPEKETPQETPQLEVTAWKMPTHKLCHLCGQTLPLTSDYFHAAKRRRTGFMSECKVCHNERKRNSRIKRGKQTYFPNQRACRVTWPDGRVESFESVSKASASTGVLKKTIAFRCRKKQLGKDGSKWEYV